MTIAQASAALAPTVVCVMAPAHEPAKKKVRLPCGCVTVVGIEVSVRSLLACGFRHEVRP